MEVGRVLLMPRKSLQQNLVFLRLVRRKQANPVPLLELLGLGPEDERQRAVGNGLALQFRRQLLFDQLLLAGAVDEDRLAVGEPVLGPGVVDLLTSLPSFSVVSMRYSPRSGLAYLITPRSTNLG